MKLETILLACLSVPVFATLPACDGEAENAGEAIDDAADDVEDAAEDAADEVEDAVDGH